MKDPEEGSVYVVVGIKNRVNSQECQARVRVHRRILLSHRRLPGPSLGATVISPTFTYLFEQELVYGVSLSLFLLLFLASNTRCNIDVSLSR